MFDLEMFCKGLHGKTGKEIHAAIDSRASSFEQSARAAGRKGRRGQTEYRPDYRGYVETLESLAAYLFYGAATGNRSKEELKLFEEVRKNMK